MMARRRLPAEFEQAATAFSDALKALPPIEGDLDDRVNLPHDIGGATPFAGGYLFRSGEGRTERSSLWAYAARLAQAPTPGQSGETTMIEFGVGIPVITAQRTPSVTVWASDMNDPNGGGVSIFHGWTPRLEQLAEWLHREVMNELNHFSPYDLVRERVWDAHVEIFQKAFDVGDISEEALGVRHQPGYVPDDD